MAQNKIIVAVDFSAYSQNALDAAAYFAEHHNSEVVMVYVIEQSRSLLDILEATHPEEKVREAAKKRLVKLEEQYRAKGIKISHIFKTGKAFAGILEAASELETEMIFMGSHGIETMGEAFVGSNATRVARKADVPVIIVKEVPETFKLNRILVPVDKEFGVRELRAFLRGYRVDFGNEVDLLAVVSERAADDELKEVETHMAKQKDAFAKIGFGNVHVNIVRHNVPSEAIIKYAENADNQIDMVLMETHGRTGISNFLMGSVTEEVIAYAKAPVLSLRPEREDVVRYYYHENLPI